MNYKEKLYFSAPVFVQHAAVSLYGLKLKRERYGKFYLSEYRQLLDSQYWDRGRHNEFQEKSFLSLIEYAKQFVPYYIGILNDYDVRAIDDLKKLPILEKEMLRVRYNEFIDVGLSKHKFIYTNTSGTTGTPLRIPIYKRGKASQLCVL